MDADIATDQHRVTDLSTGGTDVDAVGDHADAGGVDVDAIAAAAVDHFGVAGHQLDPGHFSRFADCHRNSTDIGHRGALGQDERGR